MSSKVGGGWREAALGDLCQIAIGGTPPRHKPEYWAPNGDGHPWVAISDMREAVILRTKERITDAGVANSNVKPVAAGTVMMSFKLTIGRVAVAGTDLFTNEAIAAFQPGAKLDKSFLPYWLEHIVANAETDQAIKGATLNKKKLAALSGVLPPLDEQRRIAEVLRSVDEAIATNEVVLTSCRELVSELARDLNGSCEATTSMASLGKIVTGRTPSPKQAELWGGDLPFVTPGDLVAGNISVSDASRTLVVDSGHGATVLPANSVLVTCIGSTVGKAAIARERCVTNQQINAICCPAQTAGFVYLACVAAYDTIVAHAGKQAVPIINKSTFSAIEVPDLAQSEMVEISAMVDAIDNEILAAQTSLETLQRAKATLMSDLLSGHVRVPA